MKRRKKKCTTEHRVLIYPRGMVAPEDLISFVQLKPFTRAWGHLRLTDDDLRELEMCLMANPFQGKIIPGTGGLRKVRAVPDRWEMGKRGALRICYAFFDDLFIVVLAAVYGKNRKDDLTKQEKNAMQVLLPAIREQYSRKHIVKSE